MKQGIDYLTSQTKRRLDVLGGSTLAAMSLPAAAAVGACVAMDTREVNPFFVQERVGRGGEAFATLKFRTIARAAMDTSITQGTFDSRASRLGTIIRQTGLDELPQLYNVLEGTMSLVGARPMLPESIDDMEFAAPKLFPDWHTHYLAAKPGLAGPSQVYRHHFRDGNSRKIYRRSVELDLKYFTSASLATDIKILTNTPLAMLKANVGIVENSETHGIA